jgi:hypothetical protein
MHLHNEKDASYVADTNGGPSPLPSPQFLGRGGRFLGGSKSISQRAVAGMPLLLETSPCWQRDAHMGQVNIPDTRR